MSAALQVVLWAAVAIALVVYGAWRLPRAVAAVIQRADERAIELAAERTGNANPPESPQQCERPPLSEVITQAMAWQPPVATGKPSSFDQRAALQVAVHDHVLGQHTAPITLMLFGDLRCPHTARELVALVELVQDQPAQYRLVWRHRPLDVYPLSHALAFVAEQISVQQGEPAFWRFIVTVARWGGAITTDDLLALQTAFDPSETKGPPALGTSELLERIERDRLIAMTFAIRATPTLFINGYRYEGELPQSELDEALDEEQVGLQSLQDQLEDMAELYTRRVDENLLEIERP